MPESVAAHEPVQQDEQKDGQQVTQQAAKPSTQQWRAPVIAGLQALVSAIVGIAIAAVFFPLWVAIPVAVLLAAWGLGMCVRRPEVVLTAPSSDGQHSLLTVRLGLVTRRVAMSEVEAVVLDQGKVTLGKTDKTVVSFYAWRKSKLDAWLKVPDIAGDVAHAISRAATAAQAKGVTTGGPAPSPQTGKRKGRAGNSPLIALACAGVLEIAAALITRVSWGSPAMTVLGVVVALAFGFTGMFTLVFTLWTFLTSSRR